MSEKDRYSLKSDKDQEEKINTKTSNDETVIDEDSPEEKKFYDDVKKTFGIDKTCLISVDKIYNLTVATNMLITLIATLLMVYGANYFNILNHTYTTAELFLTTIIVFTVWNFIVGYSFGTERYSISTNTALILAVFVLPFSYVGPKQFISYFC